MADAAPDTTAVAAVDHDHGHGHAHDAMDAVEKPRTFLAEYFLSCMGMAFAKSVAAPAERVRILMQTQDELVTRCVVPKSYKGAMDCYKRTLSTDGPLGLWRGNSPNLIHYSIVLWFTFGLRYELNPIIMHSQEKFGKTGYFTSLFAVGGISGATALLFTYPLDFARTRLAADVQSIDGHRRYISISDVYKTTINRSGMRGLYKGFTLACAGITVHRALYFGAYDSTKLLLPDLSKHQKLALGWLVGTTASLASYPLDTVSRRMMMCPYHTSKIGGARAFLRHVVRKGGLWRGAGVSVMQGGITGTALVGYDYLKDRGAFSITLPSIPFHH